MNESEYLQNEGGQKKNLTKMIMCVEKIRKFLIELTGKLNPEFS